MDWIQFATFMIANMVFTLTLWLWSRSEANADRRDASSDRKDILQLIHSIQDEMKDFHYRLLQIERDKK
jgi:hypothetical protein